jgi:DNA-binding PadR family transcriptional regulator
VTKAGRVRKYYRITTEGKIKLAQKQSEWEKQLAMIV